MSANGDKGSDRIASLFFGKSKKNKIVSLDDGKKEKRKSRITYVQTVEDAKSLENQTTPLHPAIKEDVEKEKEKDKISSSSCDETTTTKSIEDVFRENIGKLGVAGKKALAEYVERMGDELVLAVIGKCSDLGGSTWAYVRKALDEAESLGCKTADDYRRMCPIGSGRNTRVDRQTPNESDWLKNATKRRSLIKRELETA